MQRKPDESEEREELREEAIREKSINPLNHRSLLNLEHFVSSIQGVPL